MTTMKAPQTKALQQQHNSLKEHWSMTFGHIGLHHMESEHTYKHHLAKLMSIYTDDETKLADLTIRRRAHVLPMTRLYGPKGLRTSTPEWNRILQNREHKWDNRVYLNEKIDILNKPQAAHREESREFNESHSGSPSKALRSMDIDVDDLRRSYSPGRSDGTGDYYHRYDDAAAGNARRGPGRAGNSARGVNSSRGRSRNGSGGAVVSGGVMGGMDPFASSSAGGLEESEEEAEAEYRHQQRNRGSRQQRPLSGNHTKRATGQKSSHEERGWDSRAGGAHVMDGDNDARRPMSPPRVLLMRSASAAAAASSNAAAHQSRGGDRGNYGGSGAQAASGRPQSASSGAAHGANHGESTRPKSASAGTTSGSRQQRFHDDAAQGAPHQHPSVSHQQQEEEDLILRGLYRFDGEEEVEVYNRFVLLLAGYDAHDMLLILQDAMRDAQAATMLDAYGGTSVGEADPMAGPSGGRSDGQHRAQQPRPRNGMPSQH